ncbi:MAG TPA: three-Cys-motif partner protein TcmP [Rhizomicrobium sp.]|nr:three-Cys-motif partner protein TcmP [Rhizomicrobium sp.]
MGPPLDSDGLPISEVGEWALEKHDRLRRYVDISRAVRRKFIGRAGATYIDLYCGPGRSVLRETKQIIDGSPLVATLKAVECKVPFTGVFVGDSEQANVDATSSRLSAHSIGNRGYHGAAEETVKQVARKLDSYALHFAFLDPFNLDDIPFVVIEELSKFQRMDILIHVSVQDLQRNLRRYIDKADGPLDRVAPGWRNVVDPRERDDVVRTRFLNHWLDLIRRLDMAPSQGIELVSGTAGQRLYWLVFVSRHDLAGEFWDKIRNVTPQGRFGF